MICERQLFSAIAVLRARACYWFARVSEPAAVRDLITDVSFQAPYVGVLYFSAAAANILCGPGFNPA